MQCSVESSEIDLSEFQEENLGNGDNVNNENTAASQGGSAPGNAATEPAPGMQ